MFRDIAYTVVQDDLEYGVTVLRSRHLADVSEINDVGSPYLADNAIKRECIWFGTRRVDVLKVFVASAIGDREQVVIQPVVSESRGISVNGRLTVGKIVAVGGAGDCR